MKMNRINKMGLKFLINRAKKRINKAKLEKNEKKYNRKIDEAKEAMYQLMEIIDIENDNGDIYTTLDIKQLDGPKTEKLFIEVLDQLQELMR